jgi:PAS domain S-box-containing protein
MARRKRATRAVLSKRGRAPRSARADVRPGGASGGGDSLFRSAAESSANLLRSEKLHRSLTETMSEGIVIIDSDMRVTYVNDRFCRMIGYRREELIGRLGSEHLDAANQKIAWHQLTRRKRGIVAPYELAFMCKGGGHVHTQVSPAPIRDEHGRFGGSMSVVTDLTQLKQTEEALRQIKAELEVRVKKRTAELAAANEGLRKEVIERRHAQAAQLASERGERHLRERLARLHGVTMELSKARTFDDLCRAAIQLGRKRLGFDRLGLWFVLPDGRIQGSFGIDESGRLRDERGTRLRIQPKSQAAYLLSHRTGLAEEADVPLMDGRGQRVGRGSRITSGMWDGNEVVGYLSADNLVRRRPFSTADKQILALYADALGRLCSRERAEESLRQSEEKYRQLFATETDALVLVDATTLRHIDVNESACRLYGYTRDELVGLHMKHVVADWRISGPNVRDLVRRGSTMVPLRYHRRKDGTAVPVEIAASSFILNGRKVICGAIRDMTQRVRDQETLDAAHARIVSAREEERRRLSRELHDSVGQSLIAANLRLNVIARDPTAAGAAEAMRDLSMHLRTLSGEVRRVCRSIYPQALEALGLSAAMRQLATEMGTARPRVSVHCAKSLQKTRFPLDTEIALYRICQEALANAVQHAQADRIDLRLESSGGQLRLSVVDNGKGFRPEKTANHGLGLTSMKERADAIGATFKITSRPGRTCVEVRWP